MDLTIKEEGFECCEPDSFKLLDRYISSSDQEYERCLDIINVKRNIEELPWNPESQRDDEVPARPNSDNPRSAEPVRYLLHAHAGTGGVRGGQVPP